MARNGDTKFAGCDASRPKCLPIKTQNKYVVNEKIKYGNRRVLILLCKNVEKVYLFLYKNPDIKKNNGK